VPSDWGDLLGILLFIGTLDHFTIPTFSSV